MKNIFILVFLTSSTKIEVDEQQNEIDQSMNKEENEEEEEEEEKPTRSNEDLFASSLMSMKKQLCEMIIEMNSMFIGAISILMHVDLRRNRFSCNQT